MLNSRHWIFPKRLFTRGEQTKYNFDFAFTELTNNWLATVGELLFGGIIII